MLKLQSIVKSLAVAVLVGATGANGILAAEVDSPPAAKPGTSEADFFESKIRPLFAARCKECHGDKKQEMGLRVDRREAFFRGGDGGPVVVPGDPEKSSLIEAVHHRGDVQMPPDTKLPDEEIAALTTWVKLGAPWPEDLRQDAATTQSGKGAKDHWAFQGVQRPGLPDVKNKDWVKSPIDLFILAKLEAAGLEPSPAADKRTLVRRAYFDLLGLPPTPEEVEAFVADDRPDAFAHLVDRLLESPHYGERWGRYWLDIARYADNKGYVFEADRDYPHGYLYRDWVVQALNDDLPYDQFLLRQLAADRISQDDKSSLAAMGFLTLGRRFLNNKHDIIDDRLDVIFRGTQGLTISCARCHDHKYDPIPTADYYSMYGVLDDSEEKTVALEEPSEEYRTELTKRETAQRDFIATQRAELLAETKSKTAQYLLAAHAKKGKASEDEFLFVQTDIELKPTIVARWRTYLDGGAKDSPQVWTLWSEMSKVSTSEFPAKLAKMLESAAAKGKPEINPILLAEVKQRQPKALDGLAECYAAALKIADEQWQREVEAANGKEMPQRLADAYAEQLRQVYSGKNGPFDFDEVVFKFLLSLDKRRQVDKLRADIIEWQNSDKAPRQAYVLEDKETQSQPRVFIRGNAGNPGQAVPKQFPGVVAAEERKPFTSGSGRLEMAKIITSPSNPLTARVMVNRVWMYHFCSALVDTPSDFGTRSESPTHPELLDYLAAEFMQTGWSLKALHRTMMLSAAYQQTSLDRPECETVDPKNQLLWRMNRRRLDWEALRDSIAYVSGELDLAIGGKSVAMFAVRTRSAGNGVKPVARKKGDPDDTAPPRRTIYGFIDRQNLPGVLRAFDFALPDTHSPKRFTTVVPPQALYLMNNPFVAECAADFARRKDIASIEDETKRIKQMYAVSLGRPATEAEVSLARQFLQQQAAADGAKPEGEKFDAWDRLAQAMMMTNEFAFVD